MNSSIHEEGRNCWSRVNAGRAAVIIDGASYYEALAEALSRAERSVWMVGWDFHSRVRLRRENDESDADNELLALLEREVRRKRHLHVRILAWDFAMLYSLEREFLPLYRFDLSTHRRIHFRLDDRHPLGASQHQKIVVVDDAIAFSGGLDLTACRWDTREHRDGDARRCDPGFPDYGPFHDIQMAVDGDAAAALAELARERWRQAGGRRVRRLRGTADRWPAGLVPNFRDVDVAVARTRPAYGGRPEIREVEALYLDQIAAARETLYLENQYLSSHALAEALAARLSEEDGPEVVIVLPANLSGWLEEKTMGVLMNRVGRQLREADRFGRLRLLQPRLPGQARLTIHSKLAIVDDRILRIGSANLSNRSMGFDSECDLSIESTPERDVSREIRRVREDLLGEHLGVTAEEVAAAHAREGSLRAAIDALAGGERGLAPLPTEEKQDWSGALASSSVIFDPEQPIGFDALFAQFSAGRESKEASRGRPALKLGLGLGVVCALLALWRWTPLAGWLDPAQLSGRMAALGGADAPGTALLATLVFALASTAMVPVTAMIAACGVLFGVTRGASVALAGSVLGAGLGYALGRLLWRDAVRRLAGPRLEKIGRRLGERGILAAALLRVVPVAPFGLVNLVAGASHIRATHFLIGTAVGMLPGTLALALLGDRFLSALRNPEPRSIAIAFAVLALLLLLGTITRLVLQARGDASDAADSASTSPS